MIPSDETDNSDEEEDIMSSMSNESEYISNILCVDTEAFNVPNMVTPRIINNDGVDENIIEVLLLKLKSVEDLCIPDIHLQAIADIVLRRMKQIQSEQRKEDAIKAYCTHFSVEYIPPSDTLDNKARVK